MTEKLIKCYRELGLTKTEAMFLLEIITANGRYTETESCYSYNPSTIKKLRKSLLDKGLITWKTKPIFADTMYIYNLTVLKEQLEKINEKKINIVKEYIFSMQDK